jgi:hypothetical protein
MWDYIESILYVVDQALPLRRLGLDSLNDSELSSEEMRLAIIDHCFADPEYDFSISNPV